jgi:prevent-host-death family protein
MWSGQQEEHMAKTINAVRARGNLGRILEEVYYRGDEYIIERAGKPMAAVVPIEQYEQWHKEREEFFAFIDEVRERNRGVDQEALARDVADAVRSARKRR